LVLINFAFTYFVAKRPAVEVSHAQVIQHLETSDLQPLTIGQLREQEYKDDFTLSGLDRQSNLFSSARRGFAALFRRPCLWRLIFSERARASARTAAQQSTPLVSPAK
jgi:hypothetical protein